MNYGDACMYVWLIDWLVSWKSIDSGSVKELKKKVSLVKAKKKREKKRDKCDRKLKQSL